VIRSYQYRSPRLNSTFQIEFWSGGACYAGECKDLGLDGLRARMNRAVAAGLAGRLTLYYNDHRQHIHATVAYMRDEEAGFSFQSQTPEEVEALRAMLTLVGGLTWID
jgi:hypothetical protein